MPRLNNDEVMEESKAVAGNFGYSAVGIDHLEATEYTLVTIVQDVSGSVGAFKQEMESCLKEIVTACQKSPRADNLMIRLVEFNEDVEEIHGFKLLQDCNPDDYDDVLNISGLTALYDATENAVTSISSYGKTLTENDFSTNGIVIIITDGADNRSTVTVNGVKDALVKAVRDETLESLVTILVGVGSADYPEVVDYLDDYKKEAGLTQFVNIDEANARTLAKLAEFVSQSISSQSQALGTGGASQPLSLTI